MIGQNFDLQRQIKIILLETNILLLDTIKLDIK